MKDEPGAQFALKGLALAGVLVAATVLLLPAFQRGPLGWFFPASRTYTPPVGPVTTTTAELYAVRAARDAGYGSDDLKASWAGQSTLDPNDWTVTVHDPASGKWAHVQLEFGERVRTQTTPTK